MLHLFTNDLQGLVKLEVLRGVVDHDLLALDLCKGLDPGPHQRLAARLIIF